MGSALAKRRTPVERVSPLGVIAPPDINIESPHFTGSLATLFVCVRDRRVDLLDVPLLPICEAYFFYLIESGTSDLDEAAAALAALAYLLERKAWSLLPIADPEPEPEPLPEAAEPTAWEYATAIEALRAFHEDRQALFFRSADISGHYELPIDLGDVTPADLVRAIEAALARVKPEPAIPTVKSRRSIAEQMRGVMLLLEQRPLPLWRLIPGVPTRMEVVYTFLAILELIRIGQASVQLKNGEALFARNS